MKYDNASWHYGGDFPDDLPPEAGAIHTGMFLAWALLNGLGGSFHAEECPEDFESLKQRTITPAQFLINACDEKFTAEDLSDEGNDFAADYYGAGGQMKDYIKDYEELFASGIPSLYHVPDTWESFDRLSPRIQERYDQWKRRSG